MSSSNSENSANNRRLVNKPVPNCYCGVRAWRITSWTDENPGRRFMNCVNKGIAETKKYCNFWAWYDDEMCPRSKEVIPGLLRKIGKLEFKVKELTEDNVDLIAITELKDAEINKLKKKQSQDDLIAIIKLKEAEINKLKKKQSQQMVLVLAMFITMLVLVFSVMY